MIELARPGSGDYDNGMEVKVDADDRIAACRSLIASEVAGAGMTIGQPLPQNFVRDGKPVAVTLVIRSSQNVISER